MVLFKYLKKTGLAALILLPLISCHSHICQARDRTLTNLGVHLSSGYREDNLNWNIAGKSDGTGPNVLSELIWSDITSFQLKGQARILLLEKIFLRGSFQGGWIVSGQVQDSDFAGDDRTLEFSRSDNSAGHGNVWDISSGIGYRFATPFRSGSIEFIPLVGYSFHKQNLTLTDGFQTIPPTGPFSGLDSTFSARWYGPWLGADLSYAIDRFIIRASAEYHYFFYRGLANWNLRTDFAHPTSFRHTAQGSGVLIRNGIEYIFIDDLRLSLDFEYKNWETNPGNDRTFFANGLVSDTQLNFVSWDSLSLMLGLSRDF